MEIDIEITPNSDAILLLAPVDDDKNTYHLKILNCRLFVKTIELMDGLSLDIAKKLEVTPARYALRKTSTKTFVIGPGRKEWVSNLWTEQVVFW